MLSISANFYPTATSLILKQSSRRDSGHPGYWGGRHFRSQEEAYQWPPFRGTAHIRRWGHLANAGATLMSMNNCLTSCSWTGGNLGRTPWEHKQDWLLLLLPYNMVFICLAHLPLRAPWGWGIRAQYHDWQTETQVPRGLPGSCGGISPETHPSGWLACFCQKPVLAEFTIAPGLSQHRHIYASGQRRNGF